MAYFRRKIDAFLSEWKAEEERKPLLLRGARQVGKTTSVRHLAESFEHYVEVDLNERKDLHYLFNGRYSPQEICQLLGVIMNTPVYPGRTLLFFDEIQACPDAINRLRYFYERYPQQHLIAAGSLLEFAFESLPSFGVGRISSLFMYPFSYEEFLWATGQDMLAEAISQATTLSPLPEPLHFQAVKMLRLFLVIGGMPAVVAAYCKGGDILRCQRLLVELIRSFRDDFAKYRKRVPQVRIDAVFRSVAEQGLGKFVYSKVDTDGNSEQLRTALETLIMAGLVYPVTHTAANGIPLGAEINEKYRRMIMMDTGMLQCMLGLDLTDFLRPDADMNVVNRGAVAEAFVGIELVKSSSCFMPRELYCWHKEKTSSNAEVDYVVQIGGEIHPIEVKAGTSGSMQSMRVFLQQKNIPWGIRTSLENFCQYNDIKVYPLYAIANIFKGKDISIPSV